MELSEELKIRLKAMFQLDLAKQVKTLQGGVLTLEKQNLAEDERAHAMSEIFRAAHNIKGTSASIGLDTVSQLAKELEELFSFLRDSTLALPAVAANLLLDICDFLPELAREEKGSSQKASKIISDLQNLLVAIKAGSGDALLLSESMLSTISPGISPDYLQKKDTDDASLAVVRQLEESAEQLVLGSSGVADLLLSVAEIHEQLLGLSELIDQCNEIMAREKDRSRRVAIERVSISLGRLLGRVGGGFDHVNYLGSMASDHLKSATVVLNEQIKNFRLMPVDLLFLPLPRLVRDLNHQLGKQVKLVMEHGNFSVDKRIIKELGNAIVHLVRNAMDHGIEGVDERNGCGKSMEATLFIEARKNNDRFEISISDDGRGIDRDMIYKRAVQKNIIEESAVMTDEDKDSLIFLPGFSTAEVVSDISGRGVGLDAVYNTVVSLGGWLRYTTNVGKGTRFDLSLPISMLAEHGVVVSVAGQLYAFQTIWVDSVVDIATLKTEARQNKVGVVIDGDWVPLVNLSDLFALSPVDAINDKAMFAVVVKDSLSRIAFVVDDVVGDRELMAKKLNFPQVGSKIISSGAMTSAGEVIFILDHRELVDYVSRENKFAESGVAMPARGDGHVLVVDDLITSRTLIRYILEAVGFKVTSAVDGADAWKMLSNGLVVDLLVTDVQMPNMDGFQLTQNLRSDSRFTTLPIIIVSSCVDAESYQKGMDCGANAYVGKKDLEATALTQMSQTLLKKGLH
ncbi:MAG: response regulator [Gammaproteobacteria bacterium]|nr:response regulator [Gammaproteobacteria bacterium]